MNWNTIPINGVFEWFCRVSASGFVENMQAFQKGRFFSAKSRPSTTSEISSNYRIVLLISVTLGRVFYSLNWYDLSPGLYQVKMNFGATLTQLGILESSFLIGAGLFQLPSSYFASKWSAKSIAVGGLLVIALSNGLGAYSPSLDFLTVTRFFLGIGAAMFFSPAIALVSGAFPNERQGLALGIYNSAFNVGGVLGLYVWNYFVMFYSWRLGLLIGAILVGVAALENFLIIRQDERTLHTPNPRVALTGVLKDRQTWLMGIGVLGIWSALYVISQFLPFYETAVKGADSYAASLLASLLMIIPIFGSVLGGWLSDRARNRKMFMLIPGIAFSIGLPIIDSAGLGASFVLIAGLGLLNSFVFASMYSAPFQLDYLSVDQKAISISLMNSIQISSAFFAPILFSIIATTSGYNDAWLSMGILSIIFLPMIALMKEPFRVSTR